MFRWKRSQLTNGHVSNNNGGSRFLDTIIIACPQPGIGRLERGKKAPREMGLRGKAKLRYDGRAVTTIHHSACVDGK